jgi:ubiquinone/menaquinone biosynthesis C-methylase UbiE
LRQKRGTGTIALLTLSSRKNFAAMLSPLASAQTRAVADAMAAGQFGPSALKRRADEVRQHYDRVSASRGDYIAKNSYYYEQIYRLLRFIIPPGKRVLQVGCLTPDFLNAVEPSFGVGIDFSPKQIEECRRRFPHLQCRLHEN